MKRARTQKSVSVNIRASVHQRDLIKQAFLAVDAVTSAQFQALLDRPLPPTDTLRRLLKTKAPWEQRPSIVLSKRCSCSIERGIRQEHSQHG